MDNEPLRETPPLVPFIKRSEDGRPYLQGSKCQACGQVFVGEQSVCVKCYARERMVSVKLAETGKLYVYTVVNRTFPGVVTPFIDVVVDLDDGSHLKGTLLELAPDSSALAFDMKVKVVYREVIPVGAGGQPYMTYSFIPA